MIKKVSGKIVSKIEQMRGDKKVKVISVDDGSGKSLKVVDWEQKYGLGFRSDDFDVGEDVIVEYDESLSTSKNPYTGKPYVNRNLTRIYKPGSIQADVNPIGGIAEHRGSCQTADEMVEILKAVERLVAKDYDENSEKLNAIIEQLGILGNRVNRIMEKLGIGEDEYRNAKEAAGVSS